MISKNSISENLISCRNFLMNGRINEHILPCLDAVLAEIGSITIASTKNIVEHCVSEAINQIRDSDLISAGLILNLIHNLPLDEASEQRWNIDYFLAMELPVFLERFEEVKSARLVVLYVCKQLAHQHLPEEPNAGKLFKNGT